MRLRDCLLVEVRDATTGAVIGAGCVARIGDYAEKVLADCEAHFRTKAPASSMGVIIRCPGR